MAVAGGGPASNWPMQRQMLGANHEAELREPGGGGGLGGLGGELAEGLEKQREIATSLE